MVILQYCSDKQESARKCDSKLYTINGMLLNLCILRSHCGRPVHHILIQGTCIFILTAVAFQLWNFIIPSTWIQMHLMVMMERICSLDLRRGLRDKDL